MPEIPTLLIIEDDPAVLAMYRVWFEQIPNIEIKYARSYQESSIFFMLSTLFLIICDGLVGDWTKVHENKKQGVPFLLITASDIQIASAEERGVDHMKKGATLLMPKVKDYVQQKLALYHSSTER